MIRRPAQHPPTRRPVPLTRADLARVETRLKGLAAALLRLEGCMSEQLDRLIREVSETRGAIDSAVTFIEGVPDLVRTAVEEALAKNPGADLSTLTTLADELEADQSKIASALSAKPSAPPVEEPPAEEPPA